MVETSIGSLLCGERGVNTIFIVFTSASEYSVSPLII